MTIRAVYRNGVFTPNAPVVLPEGAEVFVTPAGKVSYEEIRAEFERRFPGLAGCVSKEAADELEQIIEEEFGQVNPDEWR